MKRQDASARSKAIYRWRILAAKIGRAGLPGCAVLQRVGRYRLLTTLGQGGMGVVYAAEDERLQRKVALKLIHPAQSDEPTRNRFWREARVAASLNHPNICQIHELGEEAGTLFIAMELLEGESLAERLARGTLGVAEAVPICLDILAALIALHARGLVHRDLKPSNVFLTPLAVKLLDFGLARSVGRVPEEQEETRSQLTHAGMIVGTPSYMAPEQARAGPVDGRADLFSVATILFEMLAGRKAFTGASVVEVLHAVLYEQPPALHGSRAVVAADRVVRRGLAKAPADRHPTASAMAAELRTVLLTDDSGPAARAVALTRLLVMPLRVLRPDPDTDFLAFSLADAVASSLTGLDSLVVRSTLAASRFESDAPDLKRIAVEAEVDVVLTGTLLRAGDQLRVSTQLVETPGGTLFWSHTAQVPLRDVFQVQDELVQRIVGSLALPLTAREHHLLKRDVPGNPRAYEFYLRANQLSHDWESVSVARDLYLRCVEDDPLYAPAWARLGRAFRIIAKYRGERAENLARAEEALQRALELNPDLPMAHHLYAQLQADLDRSQDAMVRLLRRAETIRTDPELFAGLVHVCRYAGLLEASTAAYEHARRLDPQIATSVTQTYFMLGDYQRCIDTSKGDFGYIESLAHTLLGCEAEARACLARREEAVTEPVMRLYLRSLRALLDGRREDALQAVREARSLETLGPEESFYLARKLAFLGEGREALADLEAIVRRGYSCFTTLTRDPWFDGLRTSPEFLRLLRHAESGRRAALSAFEEAGGPTALGLPSG